MTRSCSRSARVSLLAAVALTCSLPLAAQVAQAGAPAATIQLRSSSDAAKVMYRAALFEAQNVGAARIARAIDSAVKLDPQFSLARAYQAFQGPGRGNERAQKISDVMASMGSAPAAEVLLALSWRESAAGRGAAAAPIVRALAELVPGDEDIAAQYLNTQLAGKSPAEQMILRKDFTQRFPNNAGGHNSLAYLLAPTDMAAALREAQEYLRLAPTHPNAHDSYADILLLQRKPGEALSHTQRVIELDPDFTSGPMKLGVIHMMLGDATTARTDFARGRDRFENAGTKRDFTHWLAASYALSGDIAGARREITGLLGTTLTAPQTSDAHDRLAVYEAYVGDRGAVAGHVAAGAAAAAGTNHDVLSALALARAGDLDGARAAAQRVASLPTQPPISHALNAAIALQAKDLAAAERELGSVPQPDLLTKALRVDLLQRQGRKADAVALRQEIIDSSPKLDGNPQLDIARVIAKLHVQKL